MKRFILALVLGMVGFGSAHVNANTTCISPRLELATNQACVAADRFDVGEVTMVDVHQAELAVLKQANADSILSDWTYCTTGANILGRLVEFIKEEAGRGARTAADVREAELNLEIFRTDAPCNSVFN